MPSDTKDPQPAPGALVATSQSVQEVSPAVAPADRAELLTRARTFLTSPQVRLQDSDAKRTFLAEKGLTPSEIDQLLRELVRRYSSGPVHAHSARSLHPCHRALTLPHPLPICPTSSLGSPEFSPGQPVLLQLSSSCTTYEIALYMSVVDPHKDPFQRYLLPRLVQSYQARIALRKHQSALIARLTESASALKATQAESYKDLPRTVPVYEDSQYAQCHTINDLLSHVGRSRKESTQPGVDIPDITILRCALEELGRSKTDGTSTEELFRHLESKLLWLGGEEGAARQVWFALFVVRHLTPGSTNRATFGTSLMLAPCLCLPSPNQSHPALCHWITRHDFFGSMYLPCLHPHHHYSRA